jgi:hypothetical protein
LLPRFVLGVQPHQAGWGQAVIRPCPGGLAAARGKVPTPRGPILIDWTRDTTFRIAVTLPDGISARVELPAGEDSTGVRVNGSPVDAHRQGSRWILDEEISGTVTIDVNHPEGGN